MLHLCSYPLNTPLIQPSSSRFSKHRQGSRLCSRFNKHLQSNRLWNQLSKQTPFRQQVDLPIQQQGSMNASSWFAMPGSQPMQHAANQAVPEHLVHHVQPDGTVIPQVISEHLVRNIQPDLQNYQGVNLNYQYQPPSPQVQYQQAESAQPQFVP